jgi:hypothetical protein
MTRALVALILSLAAPVFATGALNFWTSYPKPFNGASTAEGALTLQSGRWNPPSPTPADWAYVFTPDIQTVWYRREWRTYDKPFVTEWHQ